MRKYLLGIWAFVLIGFTAAGQANQLWATAWEGGAAGLGTIVKGDSSGNFQLAHSFTQLEGSYPIGLLAFSNNGYIFGCCQLGGPSGSCTIFRIDTGTLDLVMEHDFGANPVTGEFPTAGMINFTNGLLYGTTYGGGTHGQGVIYSFDPVSNTYTDVHDFDTLAGGGSPGAALFANDSIFYGTSQVNTNGQSEIYAFNPTTGQYRVLFVAPDTLGDALSNLFLATDGKFYGTVQPVDPEQANGLFSIDPATQTFRLINDYDWAYTGLFNCGVYQHTNGKIYVTTTIQNNVHSYFDNCWGNIYAYDFVTDSLALVAKFSPATGYSPDQALSALGNGLLGGSCTMGGAHNSGTVFTFNPATQVITSIFSFDSSATGYSAQGGVTTTQSINNVTCPAGADSITGPANAVVNQVVNYTVPVTPGAAYNWIITGGTGASSTNGISVTWGTGSAGTLQLIETSDSLPFCRTDTVTRQVTLLPSAVQDMDEISARISPNPATGIVRLQTTGACTSYSVYDITGKLLVQAPLNSAAFDVDLGQFTQGVYIIAVQGANKEAYVKLTKL